MFRAAQRTGNPRRFVKRLSGSSYAKRGILRRVAGDTQYSAPLLKCVQCANPRPAKGTTQQPTALGRGRIIVRGTSHKKILCTSHFGTALVG